MGCSSGKQTSSIRSLKLDNVGVHSIDAFNNQIEEILEKFAALTDDLDKRRRDLSNYTGFGWHGKHGDGGLKKGIIGIILQFFSLASGDISKVKIDIVPKKPYLKIKLHGIKLDTAEKQVDCIAEYLEAIGDCFEEKIPALISSMVELCKKVVDLQANAADEFEALGDFKKLTAIAKTLKLVKDLPKIPAYMKQSLTDITSEIKEIQEICEILKDTDAVAANGKKCADSKVFDAFTCYNKIYPDEVKK